MKHKELFIEKLWKINNAGFEDMQDIKELISALMIKEGVSYKYDTDLEDDDFTFCVDRFDSNVEETFFDRINTKNINFYEFQRQCLLFMDFSKMYCLKLNAVKGSGSSIFNLAANIVKQDALTRFGISL